MERVSDGHVQREDNEGAPLSPTCLRIPLILGKILEHSSNSELLQLSLVNKLWNYEARSVMKERGTLIAHLSPQQPCKELALFASHVQQMNIVPYSGLCFHFDHHTEEEDHDLTCEAYDSTTSYLPRVLCVKARDLSI